MHVPNRSPNFCIKIERNTSSQIAFLHVFKNNVYARVSYNVFEQVGIDVYSR